MKVYIYESRRGGISRIASPIIKKIVFTLCTIVFSLFLFTPLSYAQEICIPEAKGVPGSTWDRPPNWWDSSETYVYSTDLDDPQWRGCFKQNFPIGGTGTIEDVSFRALHKIDGGVEYLYLSWHAKVVPALDLDFNKLFVGFHDPSSAGDAVVITITPTTTAEATATFDYEALVQVKSDSGWDEVDAPSWLNETRIWVIPGTNNEWAVQMRVKTTTTSTDDLEEGINIGSNFWMWYEVMVADPTETLGFTPYTWPVGVEVDLLNDIPPFPTDWGEKREYRMITGAPDSSCSTDGVAIYKEDIGTENDDPREIEFNGVNTFFARPRNLSGTQEFNGIKARFRIANWGVQPIWEEGEEEGEPVDELWDDIADEDGVPLAGIDLDPGEVGYITTNWTLGLCDKCKFKAYYDNHEDPCNNACTDLPAVKRRSHQCLLVNLIGGPGVTFLNDSVYNNMDFIGASKFQRDAEIKIKGLPVNPFGGTDRDVYLYVQALNMPEFVKGKTKFKMPGRLFGKGVSIGENYSSNNDIENREDREEEEEQSYEKIAKRMPTYIVHAYYDTGKRKPINGVDHPILKPMTSFGYFVNHEGGLDGWAHSLKGKDATLKEISPNFYKIVIPNDGVATVTTTIKAIESNFAISARLGWDFPHGVFDNIVDSGLSFNGGLEYLFSQNISLEAVFGYHHFADEGFGDQNIIQISGNLRFFYPITNRLRTFFNGGAGLYKMDPGDSEFGYNVGAGFDFYITTQFALEAAYNYHTINTTGDRLKFSTAQGGFRFKF